MLSVNLETAKRIGLENILNEYKKVCIFEFGRFDLTTSEGKNNFIAKFL